MSLASQIESILFVASRPLSLSEIAKALQKKKEDIEQALQELEDTYRADTGSGILLFHEGERVQMGTNPEYAASVEQFVKEEGTGELTRAQLETLTVIAYREPITRAELEQIRGVNCAVILRILLLRGLVEEQETAEHPFPLYVLSFDALRHLGIQQSSELPEYEVLSQKEQS